MRLAYVARATGRSVRARQTCVVRRVNHGQTAFLRLRVGLLSPRGSVHTRVHPIHALAVPASTVMNKKCTFTM